VYLYSALFVVPHTQDAQAWITQCYLQLHQCLPLPRNFVSVHQMAPNQTEVAHCSLLLIVPYGRRESGSGIRTMIHIRDRVQKLISSSMSRHLSTRNISSKSMHAFLSNRSHRQTNERGHAGENIHLLRCRM